MSWRAPAMPCCRRPSSDEQMPGVEYLGGFAAGRAILPLMATKPAERMVQMATRVPASLVQQVKVWCVEREMSVMQFVAEALRVKLRRGGKRTS